MKLPWKYIVVFLLLGMIFLGFVAPKEPLKSYYYQNRETYHGGTTEYFIYEENGAISARYLDYIFEDTIYFFEKNDIDRKELQWVDSMLNETNVRRWRSYYQPMVECRDGNNWSAKVEFSDDTIYSRGYMITPDNARLHKINERIKELSGFDPSIIYKKNVVDE